MAQPLAITAKMKAFFFDRTAVTNAVDAAKVKRLSLTGAIIMRHAQRIQKPKRPGVYSPAGQPPYSHVEWQRRRENRRRKKLGAAPLRSDEGFKGLRHIYFFYDRARGGVIVGPVSETGGHVTHAHEYGGQVRSWKSVAYYPGPYSDSRRFKSVPVVKTYPPRPYMRPALEHAISRLPEIWRDSVRVSPGGAAAAVESGAA